MTERLEVACAVEGEYAFHSAAMLRSVLENRGDSPVRIHYLHGDDLPPDFARPLAEMVGAETGCSISFVEVEDERCRGLPIEGFTGKATWYRIFLPELLPDVDRILSLDVDLIALDPLSPLWATDLEGAYLGAVTNVLAPKYMNRPADLGLNPRSYFNAGVMLMDLHLMRTDGCTERIRRYAVDHAPELALRDQDALNFVLAENRLPLHPRWNAMNALFRFPWSAYVFSPGEIEEAQLGPAIRHFEGPGPNKPWHYLCDRKARAQYATNRLQTPWPAFRQEGRTLKSVIRRHLSRFRR